jgi:hypothetical protein
MENISALGFGLKTEKKLESDWTKTGKRPDCSLDFENKKLEKTSLHGLVWTG